MINNAVGFCGTCHKMYNRATDPGFVFFPTDLRFFIDYELRDRENLKLNKLRYNIRRLPSAEEYRQHQVRNGTISANAEGGLYRRVFLQEYFHFGTGFSAREFFKEDVEYGGNPFGIVWRAFKVLRSAQVGVIPAAVEMELSILKNLYYRDNFDVSSIPKLLELVAVDTTEEKESGTESQNTPDEDGADEHAGQPRQWMLGPEYTAADTIKRYSPVIEDIADAAQEGPSKRPRTE